MARVFVIACNVTDEPYPVYPLGASLVTEALRRAGHEARLLDVFSEGKGLEAALGAFDPDVVGLSLRNVDNVDSQRLESYTDHYGAVAGRVRGVTDAPIVLGGTAFSLFPEALLERTGAVYGVVGEGEVLFPWLVDAIVAGRAAPGVYPKGRPPVPAPLPPLPRDAGLARFYNHEGGMLNLQTKRGCPHRCAYCTYPLLEGRRYRFRDPAEVVEEMEMLRDVYGARYLAITDSVLNDVEERYVEIAEELVRREWDLPWMAFMRPMGLTQEKVDLLKRAGLASVEWGTDCASDTTLAGMQKDFCWGDVEESNRLLAAAEVAQAHFVIFGGPGETMATAEEGLANLERLERCVVFAFLGVRVFPRAPIVAIAEKDGLLERGQGLLEPVFYFSPMVEPAAIGERIVESFQGRADRLFPPGSEQEKIKAFHRLGYPGPVWDFLLK